MHDELERMSVMIHPDCKNNNPITGPAKPGDVGYDLKVWIPDGKMTIQPFSMANIRTGVFIKLPDGTWADVRPRSSTFAKRKLIVMGGTIDCGYTGELSVFIFNPTTDPHPVNNGDRLAQIVICRRYTPEIHVVSELPRTDRGQTGFGSTDA